MVEHQEPVFSEAEQALQATVHVLQANYRSARSVAEMANDLLKIMIARFGSIDRESTALVRPASAGEGSVIGLAKNDAVVRALNERTRKSAEVAVIVLDEARKAEARQKFSTPPPRTRAAWKAANERLAYCPKPRIATDLARAHIRAAGNARRARDRCFSPEPGLQPGVPRLGAGGVERAVLRAAPAAFIDALAAHCGPSYLKQERLRASAGSVLGAL